MFYTDPTANTSVPINFNLCVKFYTTDNDKTYNVYVINFRMCDGRVFRWEFDTAWDRDISYKKIERMFVRNLT